MKKNYILTLSVVGACWVIGGSGCSQSGPSQSASGGSTMKGSGGSSGSGGSKGSGGSSSGSGGDMGGGSGGSEGTCDMLSLQTFSRSDTELSWDDNDFSDVVLEGSCPVVANVTWPHEADWENKDPSEANREMTRFTLDSSYSSDLTGKQINVELELTGDMRGSKATAGGYIVSLVSVSQYDMVVVGTGGMGGAGGGDSGGASGAGGAGGGSGGEGGVGPGGADGRAGNAGGGGRGGPGMGGRRGGGGRGGVAGAGVGGSVGGTVGAQGGVGGTVSGSGGTTGSGGSTGSGGDNGGSGGSTGSGGDSGGSGGSDVPATVTAYTEAETPVQNRVTLSKVGDKASFSFALPSKMAAVGSYDPMRPIKINIRIYSVFSSTDTPVYDYLTSQFTIRKFSVTDAPK